MNASTLFDGPEPRSLADCLSDIADVRTGPARRHELLDILVIACCTYLCGGETFNDMELFGQAAQEWLGTFLALPNGIPSHDTFNRVFQSLSPGQFQECFIRWMQGVRKGAEQEVVALDGKALRRAAHTGGMPHMVSAWAVHNGLVLGQMRVFDKSNEITAIPELLRRLELTGCIVTIDAAGCQRRIAREIVEADADYVLALKGNQGTAHEEVKTFLDDAILHTPQILAFHEEPDKGHGRWEIRRCWQTDHVEWFADRKAWENLTSVGVIESVRTVKGVASTQRRYYLSSLTPDAARLSRAVRSHWEIENKLHWVLDVQFGEDQCRARTGFAAENLATLRHLTLNMLRGDLTSKHSIRSRRKLAGWDRAYLVRLLGFSPRPS
jgi:predicted transposase YbfD/YdcC